MVKKAIDEDQEKLDQFLDSDYYDRVIDAWFIALKKAGGLPEKIQKKYIMEDGGIVHHQRFNRHIGGVNDVYVLTRIKFCREVKKVAHAYEFSRVTGQKLWSLYFDTILSCDRECEMALVRNDDRFFIESINLLQSYFSETICESSPEKRVYHYSLAAAYGVIIHAVREWAGLEFADFAKERITHDIAGLLYSLNHPMTSFSRVLGNS